MARLSFALRRHGMLLRGMFADRDRPDLDALSAIEDPEAFVWAILPHAARSFAASIVMLPADKALPAAVAYLYCRMLDTYEDLIEGPPSKREALDRFADRFGDDDPEPAPRLVDARPVDRRDLVHILLVERCSLIDRVFVTLPPGDRANIAELVVAMGHGMAEAVGAFDRQGRVLETRDQLLDYCHTVIGEPALFVMRLLARRPVVGDRRDDALEVSEMIQLANVTRDIERDLERGIGYDPRLRPFLFRDPATDEEAAAEVRRVREELTALALSRAPAYRRLVEALDTPPISAIRASALLMLLFTDRHYRECAARTGHEPWGRRVPTPALIAQAMLAGLSRWWTDRRVRAVESDFLEAARHIGVGEHQR